MRFLAKITAAALVSTYAVLAHAGFQEDLVKRFPAAAGAKVAQAFPGFHSVVKGSDVFFVRDDFSILISGAVIDLKNKRNLTQALQQENRPTVDVTQLNLNDAIKFGSGTRKLYIFSDPDCPYCRLLDGDLTQLSDVTIYIFPFPIAQLHPNAPGIAEAIWCQKDRTAAWSKYQELARTDAPAALMTDWHNYLHSLNQPDQPTCENPIPRNIVFGAKWQITGTPALIFEDGSLVPGRESVTALESQLAAAHAKAKAKK